MPPRYCILSSQTCVEVRGADAAAFLHGQLSRTVVSLDQSYAPLAGWHDARGRVRAVFRVVRRPEAWWLLTQRDVAAVTANRLRMFVLRAAVTIAVGDELQVGALVGTDDAWLEVHGLQRDAPNGGTTVVGKLTWIRVGPSLWHVVGPREAVERFGPSLPRAPDDAAALEEIRLGIPAISAALVERFVPQMLNLDLLDGISFDKGCYPGQEVIARVHHRGSVKRRMRRYACAASTPPAAGTEVAMADGAAVGEVVRAARADSGVELLAVVDDAAAGTALTAAGTTLRELLLPYTIPAD
jgi:tRNA-modifying protein YgfZ